MHDLTRVVISQSSSSTSRDGLTLTVTCELPRELSDKPLTWRMYLEMQSASATTAELVFPLVEAHRAQQEQIKSLVEIIKQKDSVITKVLDKLEATGTSLEHVFTVLPAKRKVTREQAESRIKGLALFDFDTWNSTVAEETRRHPGGEVPELLRRVFDDGGLEYTLNIGSKDYAEDLAQWWNRLGDTGGLPSDDASEPESTIGKRSVPPSSRHDSQRSKSPPPVSPKKRPSPKAKQPKPSDLSDVPTASETESEADEAPKPAALPTRRLGAIGGFRPPPATPKPPIPADDDEATASESDEAPTKRKATSRKQASSPPAAATRAGTTRAGGPASELGSSTRSPTPEEHNEPAESSPPARTPARKAGIGRIGGIGVIGGKSRARQASADDEDDNGGRNGGEAAKREEKAQSPVKKQVVRPVKKKRKF